ncbi:NACHT, LRR and PYD domains-containing protein 1 homolog [Scomber scombrus]|uniref:NACHT, LRR and PYD domains-containing protein 1 homolog n=1 Tax=Scomber scombrus TaxID=13677 RepID=UPI002DDC1BF3|nr:NACHT, LRR and PYD domains-containing protein 1 homolog [Scomber scombrus]
MSNAAGSSGGEEIPMSHIRRRVNISDEEASENRGPSSSQTRPPPEVSTISSQSEVDVSDDDEASENRGPSSSQPRPLPEVSTISSQNEGTSRSSESGSITDSSDWTTLEPEVNSPDADEAPTYSLQSEAGRFECRVSNLQWVCKEKVSFKYQFGTLPEYMERTERLGYMPAGPILDITVISGKLNEVYLPHWICTDDSTISDKFAVLHVDDACGDVVEEVSEVTPHHVKLLEPTFSPRMVLVRLGLPVTIKCNVLIYYKLKRSLNLHVYLIPHDPGLQKTVHQRENKDGYKEIRKPHPDRYLGMEQIFILTADMNTAKVTPPQGLTLRYHSSEPNFYEVVIKNPDRDVNLKLKREEPVSEPVWTCGIEEDDYSNSGEGGAEMQRRIHVETLTPADSYPPLTLSSGREEMQMRPEEHPAFEQSLFIQEEEDDTTIKEKILKLLQRLSEEEFKDFKWYLQNEKSRPIPQSKLEKADRTHVVDLIEQTYGHQAVKVIKDIFKKMKRNDLVRRL